MLMLSILICINGIKVHLKLRDVAKYLYQYNWKYFVMKILWNNIIMNDLFKNISFFYTIKFSLR